MKKILIVTLMCVLIVVVLASCNNVQLNQTTEITETIETTETHLLSESTDVTETTTETTYSPHLFGEWTVVAEPTCDETGLRERVCVCGEKETDIIPATGHDVVDGICTNCGYMPYTENLYYILKNDEYYEVYCVSCQEKVINIPGEHDGKPVRVVRDFGDRDFIEVINIAEGITTISKNAFKGLPNLRKINLPNSLTTIEENAFTGSGLTEIIIPDSVTSIGDYAFSECKQLKEVVLSSNVRNISYFVFRNCESLESILIPDGVTSIQQGAFYECKSLNTITLPGTIEYIGCFVFRDSGIRHLIINEGVKDFPDDALLNCKSLETVELPSSVWDLNMQLFSGCTGLKDVYINATKEHCKSIIGYWPSDEIIDELVIHCIDGDLYKFDYLGIPSDAELVTSDFSPVAGKQYVAYIYVSYTSETGFAGNGSFRDGVFVSYAGADIKFKKHDTVAVVFDGADYVVEDKTLHGIGPRVVDVTTKQTITDVILARLSGSHPSEPVLEKPIIYLYPEKDTVCTVKLDLNGEITCSYPECKECGWENFIAKPDGTLVFPDGSEYYALYWEGKGTTDLDMTTGFCIKGSDTVEFLSDILSKLGLSNREAKEFIIYWLPRMQNNAYNLISFQTSAYTDSAKLMVSPTPDTVIRVFMAYMPLENSVEIAPQTIVTPERNGFVVVEWGGSEVK